jgi:hypothetical protein
VLNTTYQVVVLFTKRIIRKAKGYQKATGLQWQDGTLDSKERRTREDRAVRVGGRDQEGRKGWRGEGNSSAFMRGRRGEGRGGRELMSGAVRSIVT